MGHRYNVFYRADGGFKVVQLAMQGGTYERPTDYPDFILAMGEEGRPRVTEYAYAPASLYEQKEDRIVQAKQRTIGILALGVDYDGYVAAMEAEAHFIERINACQTAAEITALEDCR
jgi:hypothetical protein